MSGAAEHIDNVYRDAENMGVLALDGTSNDILSFKLMSLMVEFNPVMHASLISE